MSKKEKENKEPGGLKDAIKKRIIVHNIVHIVVVACSWWLVFRLWGPAENVGTLLGYIVCMIPFFSLQLTFGAFASERVELAHGKTEIKEYEVEPAAKALTSLWGLIFPRGFIYSFGSMLIIVALIQYSGWQPPTIAAVFIVLVVPVIIISLLIKGYMPQYLQSFAAALKNENKAGPQPLVGYLVVEHVVPCFFLQAYINGCVANRAFHFEMAKLGTSFIPADYLAQDAFIIFVILALFQWLGSNEVTRGDVRLGRVSAEKLKHLSGWMALVYIFGGALVVAAVFRAIFYIGMVDGTSVGIAMLYKMAAVALSVLLGSWVGIRWGGAREQELIRGDGGTEREAMKAKAF